MYSSTCVKILDPYYPDPISRFWGTKGLEPWTCTHAQHLHSTASNIAPHDAPPPHILINKNISYFNYQGSLQLSGLSNFSCFLLFANTYHPIHWKYLNTWIAATFNLKWRYHYRSVIKTMLVLKHRQNTQMPLNRNLRQLGRGGNN